MLRTLASPRHFVILAMMAGLLLACLPGQRLHTRAVPFGAGVASAQIDAGYLADVEDRKITETYSTGDNATDVSLALVPVGPDGVAGITLVLRARFAGRTPAADGSPDMTLRAHYRVLSDERTRSVVALSESHQLRLSVGVDNAPGITLRFFPANWGYSGFTAPGDEIPVAWFSVTPADLRAMALADRMSGEVLWTPFVLTPEQLGALREFAARVLPPSAS